MRYPGLIGILSILVAIAACSHTEPLRPGDYGTDVPFRPGPPIRLTANRGTDEEISFTPDGRNLVYTVNARCLALLGAHQGRDSTLLCPPPIPNELGYYSHGAISANNRLAVVLARIREVGSLNDIVVTSLADLRGTTDVVPVPFATTVDGKFHLTITRLTWLRGDTLAILADSAIYLTDPAIPVVPRVFVPLSLPGQVYVMQPSADGSILYVRIVGDSRVLAWDMATRALLPLHDFVDTSAALVAVGTRHLAVAIPGGLVRINLANSRTDTVPTFNLVITELAMTPDGSDIIATATDTTGLPPPGGRITDLYRLNP